MVTSEATFSLLRNTKILTLITCILVLIISFANKHMSLPFLAVSYMNARKIPKTTNSLAIISLPDLQGNRSSVFGMCLQECSFPPRSLADCISCRDVFLVYSQSHPNLVFGFWALAYIALQTAAIPGTIFLSLLAGSLWGVQKGLFLVSVISTIGSCSCYFLSWLVGRRLANRVLSAERLASFSAEIAKRSKDLFNYIIFLRMTPILPNVAINVASPIVGVPLLPFALGTLFGCVPNNFVVVSAGSRLSELSSLADLTDPSMIGVSVVIGLVALAPVLWKHRLEKQAALHHIKRLKEVLLDDDLTDADFVFYSISAAILVLMAGLMSGLTLGLMSLDEVDLEILRRSGSPKQKAHAQIIMPVIANQHRLLVTLLLCNAVAAEALPLCIDRLADPITAIVVSVTVVLFFGEIIPQAACSAYGLQIGAVSAPFVQALMFVTWPINTPVAWILDRCIGHRRTALFKRAELKALVDIHGEEAGQHALSPDEVKVIKGALDLTSKRAKTAMTPLDLVYMLSSDATLNEDRLTEVLASGHSRIPVHKPGDRRSILGILLVKELILVDPNAGIIVSQMKIRSLPHLLAETFMYDMLKLFEIGRSHMAVLIQPTADARAKRGWKDDDSIDVYSIDDSYSEDDYDERPREGDISSNASETSSLRHGHQSHHSRHNRNGSSVYGHDYEPHELEPVGIITIEDVIEELLGSEIVDETDQWVDNMRSTRVNAAVLTRSLPDHLRRAVTSWGLLPRIGNAGFMQAGTSGRARTSLEEMESGERDAYSNLPRVMMPSRPRPKSVAGQLQQQAAAAVRPVLVSPDKGPHGGRRNVNVRSGVQQQIDLLEPLLARRRVVTEGVVLTEGNAEFDDLESARLTRQNSI